MCNSLHGDSKKIEEEGIGYKMFQLINGNFYPICYNKNICVDIPFEKINSWDPLIYKKNYDYYPDDKRFGFCFFLNLKDAFISINEWKDKNVTIKRIKYKKGIGKHNEFFFVNSLVEIALCKEFEIIY